MDSNDVNRRVRYALSLDDDDVIDLLRLSAFEGDTGNVQAWRLKEGADGYMPCPPEALQAMLAGLIIRLRGVRDDQPSTQLPAQSAQPVTQSAQSAQSDKVATVIDNNAVLKQIRIALSLKTDDVHALIVQGGGKLGKSEVNALFRKPSARNFRRCGDQVLRWFLAGLATQRKGSSTDQV